MPQANIGRYDNVCVIMTRTGHCSDLLWYVTLVVSSCECAMFRQIERSFTWGGDCSLPSIWDCGVLITDEAMQSGTGVIGLLKKGDRMGSLQVQQKLNFLGGAEHNS